MRAPLVLVLAAAFVACSARAAAAAPPEEPTPFEGLGPLERKLVEKLSKTRATGNVVLHFDPDALSPGEVDAAAARNAGFWAEVEKKLEVRPPVPVHVFLYRDAADMRAKTNREESSVAWSSGHTIHAAHDYGDCHEFVHVFAQHLPKDEESVPPEGFFVEGLATALQARDQGVAMSDWAAVALAVGRVPPLVELRRTWPKGAPAGVHPYHLAGSFLDFLIERFGIEKVKRLYTHCLEFHGVLGRSFAALEREWRAWLAARKVAPDHEEHVLRRMGIPKEKRLPAEVRDRKGVPLFDGKTLDGWKPEAGGVWTVRDGLLVATHAGKWTRIDASSRLDERASTGRHLGVRLRFRMTAGNAFQLRLGAQGGNVEAIFAAWKSFLVVAKDGGPYEVVASSDFRFAPGEWVDAVFADEGGTARVYVNGCLVLESPRDVGLLHRTLSLAVEEGTVEVASVELIPRK